MICKIKGILDSRGGLKAVYFVACGGSQAAIYPGKYLLDAEARNIPTKIYNSNEFVYVTPKSLDQNCLVICCSLKATAETVQAVHVANHANAVTISLTGSIETEMAKVGQFVVTYSSGDQQIYSQANQAQVLRICFELLHQFEQWEAYQKALSAFDHIDALIAQAKVSMKKQAVQFAQTYRHDQIFYVISAGPLIGTGYTMVNCHLIEMQARHACLIHSGEYFHGPFETTDEEVAIILLKSTGPSRFLDERVESFLQRYAKRYMIIDAADTQIEEVMDIAVAPYFNSVVMIPLERYFVSVMAELRGRSMNERKYMWKVPY
jgi:fructoselysine 6-phosphate deglycase